MFTGIIQSVGKVQAISPAAGGDWQLSVAVDKLDMSDVALGDSIAVNGVCLTVIAMTPTSFVADVSNETLTVTAFAGLSVGGRVNLEKALRLADRLGGHMVSGHVDGVGVCDGIVADGRSWRYQFSLVSELARYVCAKGSITINGVSLTVNSVTDSSFSVNLVPHTLQETNLGDLTAGNRVNLEVDMIARYLERLLQGGAATNKSSAITPEFLAENGFWK
jgi:riboflavin synthase